MQCDKFVKFVMKLLYRIVVVDILTVCSYT